MPKVNGYNLGLHASANHVTTPPLRAIIYPTLNTNQHSWANAIKQELSYVNVREGVYKRCLGSVPIKLSSRSHAKKDNIAINWVFLLFFALDNCYSMTPSIEKIGSIASMQCRPICNQFVHITKKLSHEGSIRIEESFLKH